MATSLIRFGWLATEVDVRNSRDADYPLMSVSQYKGVIPRAELMGNSGRAESLDNYKICNPGDLVINRMSASSGALGLARESGLVSPDYAVLRPTPLTYGPFLTYLMKSDWFVGEMTARLRGIGAGGESASVRTPRVNIADLKDVIISLPTLDEQRRIANYLDEQITVIDRLINLKSNQRDLYSDIHDEVRDEMLWESSDTPLISLKYLVRCNLQTLPSSTAPNFRFHYVDVSSVNFRTGIQIPEGTLSFGDAPSRARRVANEGDVIFSMVRPYLRAVSVVQGEHSSMIFSTAFAVLQPNELKSQFLFEALTSNKFLSETEKWSAGMGYPAINESDLLAIKVPFPSAKKQIEIGSSLQQEKHIFEKIITSIELSIGTLRLMKQSLITAAVTGTFDVTTGRSVA